MWCVYVRERKFHPHAHAPFFPSSIFSRVISSPLSRLSIARALSLTCSSHVSTSAGVAFASTSLPIPPLCQNTVPRVTFDCRTALTQSLFHRSPSQTSLLLFDSRTNLTQWSLHNQSSMTIVIDLMDVDERHQCPWQKEVTEVEMVENCFRHRRSATRSVTRTNCIVLNRLSMDFF